MQKILYNDCFGGFSISNFAKVEYVKRVWKNKPFTIWHNDYLKNTKTQLTEDEAIDTVHSLYFLDSEGNLFDFPCWHSDSDTRKDLILISLLEEYGSEKISSRGAKLKIAELDDNQHWTIYEYDGAEEVLKLNINKCANTQVQQFTKDELELIKEALKTAKEEFAFCPEEKAFDEILKKTKRILNER